MKTKLILIFALVLSGAWFGFTNTASADETISNTEALNDQKQAFESIMGLIDTPHLQAAADLYFKKLGTLNLSQRNAIFLGVARSLVVTNANTMSSTVKAASEVDVSALMALNNLSEDSYETDLVGLKKISWANRSITTPDAIPLLINALDVSHWWDAHILLQILSALTHRDTGYVNGDEKFIERNHAAVVGWWQDWWAKNKNRHPVFDKELTETVTSQVRVFYNQIFLEVKGYENGVAYAFSSGILPADQANDDVMVIKVDSSQSQITPQPQIYLVIAAQFETPTFQLHPVKTLKYPVGVVGEWQPMGMTHKVEIQEVCRKELPGTDIAITVDAASLDGQFPNLVRACLQKPPESMQPEIARLTQELNDPLKCRTAARALVRVNQFTPVIEKLSNTNTNIRQSAIIALGGIPLLSSLDAVDADSAGTLLIHILQTNDAYTRYLAAWALGHVHKEDAVTVDALIAAANDKDSQTRTAAIVSLGEFKSQARVIVPVLKQIEAETNSEATVAAEFSLKELAPYLEQKARQ